MDAVNMINSELIKKLVEQMRNETYGIKLHEVKGNDREMKRVFTGNEAVTWIIEHFHLSRDEAVSVCQTLLSQSYVIVHTEPSAHFQAADSAQYYFNDQTTKVEERRRQRERLNGGYTRASAISPIELISKIQRCIFNAEEQVKAAIHIVTTKRPLREGNKHSTTKEEFLCLNVHNTRLRLQHVRRNLPQETYSILKTWSVDELRIVEMDDQSDTGFVLAFDRPYFFFAPSSTERNRFLWTLLQLCQEYLKAMPQTSIDTIELRLLLESNETTGSSESVVAYHKELMTEDEERQIEEILKSRVMGHDDLNVLSERLARDLARLESENIHRLIESHDALCQLGAILKRVGKQLEPLKSRIHRYHKLLDNMTQHIAEIEHKNNTMEIVMRNHKALLYELDDLLSKIRLDNNVFQILERCDFDNLTQLQECTKAMQKVYDALNAHLKPNMTSMVAVQQQMEYFKHVCAEFSQRFLKFLTDKFKKLAEETMAQKKDFDIMFDGHKYVIEQLIPYQTIVHLLKQMIPPIVESAAQTYVHAFAAVYRRELRDYFDTLRKSIFREHVERIDFKPPNLAVSRLKKIPGVATGLYKLSNLKEILSRGDMPTSRSMDTSNSIEPQLSEGTGDDDTAVSADSESDEGTASGREHSSSESHRTKDKKEDKERPLMKVPKAWQTCLATLLSLITTEQKFCCDFFQFSSESSKQRESEVQRLLNGLFEGLSKRFRSVISTSYKVNHYYLLTLWVETAKWKRDYEERSSFLSQLLIEIQFYIQERWAKFIDAQIKYIKEAEPTRFRKAGVLTNVKKYPRFVDEMEQHDASTPDGRILSESAYVSTAQTLFHWLDQCATGEKSKQNKANEINVKPKDPTKGESATAKDVSSLQKKEQQNTTSLPTATDVMPLNPSDPPRRRIVTAALEEKNKLPSSPKSVISVGTSEVQNLTTEVVSSSEKSQRRRGDEYTRHILLFENYHHFYFHVAKKNVDALKKFVEQAESAYKENIHQYVLLLIQKRFAALIKFFSGVDKLYTTIPHDTVQYQPEYTNLQLSKLIAKYSPERFAKEIYKVYKRIRVYLSEEEGLIPVAWTLFQEHFTNKLRHFEARMKECYRQQRLSVTSDEVSKLYKEAEIKWAKKLEKNEKSLVSKKNKKQKEPKSLEQTEKENVSVCSSENDDGSSDEDEESPSSSQEAANSATKQ